MSPRTKRPAGVVTTAPCRVDLAGGTVDIWPLYLFHRGAVTVNFAVNVLTTCRVSPLPAHRIHLISKDTGRDETFADHDALCSAKGYRHPLAAYLVRFFAPEGGVEVETNSESPAGAGISGSSALMIATTAALARYTDRRLDREQMRVLAQNVEAQLINVPTGCQDYYPALYGGIEALHLEPDGIHREALPVPPSDLDGRFVLVYTGAPRQSGINNWEVFKSHVNGDKKVFHNFDEIVAIARSMRDALIKADWEEVSKLLRAEWKLRKTNAPAISTPEIEDLMKVAWRWGGQAAKVCGAGGGGCVVFLVEPEARQRVVEAFRNHGAQVLPAKVARDGLTYASARLKS